MFANNSDVIPTFKVVSLLICLWISYPAFTGQDQIKTYSDEDIVSGIRASLKSVIDSKKVHDDSPPNVILF